MARRGANAGAPVATPAQPALKAPVATPAQPALKALSWRRLPASQKEFDVTMVHDIEICYTACIDGIQR